MSFFEADHCRCLPIHARHCWRQRRTGKSQGTVARAEARLALIAMVVGSPKRHVSQRSREGLVASAGIVGLVSAWAQQVRADIVTVVGVEPLLNCTCRDGKCPAACSRFEGLEIQPISRTGCNQRFDFTDDFDVKRFFEPPFLAASFEVAWGASSCASAHCSQASQ